MFGPQTKILVVDDMKTMRAVVKKNLTALGLENVVEAEDGQAAWVALENADKVVQPFQLIISDWNMPNVTGIELLKKCKGDPRFKTVPFVLVTAENEKEQVVQAAQLGVSAYITKPFDTPTLQARLLAVYAKVNKK